MTIFEQLPKPFFVLAPMDDVTDTVFRQIVASLSPPDLFFTEFANVDGLQSPGRLRLMKKLIHTGKDQPLIAHIWGKNPENFYKTAREIASGELGNFVGIDLNMGCPAKSEVKAGTCSALIKPENRSLASEIIKATQAGAAGKLPVSVKTRLGFSEIDLSWHEFLLGHDLAVLTIHGRTRKEMSKVPAHWDEIGQVRRLRDKLAPGTLVVGNGDVASRQHGLELAEKYLLDGIMIGRGTFHDPFIFSRESPWNELTKAQRIALYQRHVELFMQTWQEGERPIHTLNKFCKVYISGFDGASEFRARLMQAPTGQALLAMLDAA